MEFINISLAVASPCFILDVNLTLLVDFTGVKTTAFETQFYASQATAWAFGGGGYYWSWK